MNSRITQQELESYLWGAAVLLRGLIDAGDYKQFIFPLLFFKRISDIWDEEYQSALTDSDSDLSYTEFAENHRFQIPEGAHWNDVHLMTQLLAPQVGESIYDPTCGTGGMLISALAEVKRSGGEYRTLNLFGQERNLITSGIARMNLFLHGVEDFKIIRGDTLADPRHIEGDRLRKFDVILANPPYSIKQWDRTAFEKDKWGRNFLGTPPQGRADYAFQQHILASLSNKGRCAVLWPHGVLFRNEEQAMRAKMVEQDCVEAVIGLGPNLFYNSPMESCIVVCNRNKSAARKHQVLFIDALNEVTRERAQSFLKPEHQHRILDAFQAFADQPGFAKVVTLTELQTQACNLSIPLYVKRRTHNINSADSNGQPASLTEAWDAWQTSGQVLWLQMDALVETLDGLLTEEDQP